MFDCQWPVAPSKSCAQPLCSDAVYIPPPPPQQEVLKVEPPLSEEDLGYHVVAGTDPEQSTFWTPATKEEELREQLKELRVGQIQSQALK